MKKKCSVCGVNKPLSDYYKNASSPDNRRADCKDCRRGKFNHRKRGYRLFKFYGLTTATYLALLKKCNGQCQICKRQVIVPTLTEPRTKWAQVDHCHKTGRVRGILCMYCNTALAKVGDNPVILKRMIEYLS